MDRVGCYVPERHGVGPAKPQYKRLRDVHALRAHHRNNVFKQRGGGRSANNLLSDTHSKKKQRHLSNVKANQVITILPDRWDLQ